MDQRKFDSALKLACSLLKPESVLKLVTKNVEKLHLQRALPLHFSLHVLLSKFENLKVTHFPQWGDPESFFRGGLTFFTFFFLLGESGSKYRFKRAIIGPEAKGHLNGVSLMGRWWPNTKCCLASFVILQGIRTNIAKKPYIFVIFQGGRGSRPFGCAHVLKFFWLSIHVGSDPINTDWSLTYR